MKKALFVTIVLLGISALGYYAFLEYKAHQKVEVPIQYRCEEGETEEHPIFQRLNYRATPEGDTFITLPKDSIARVDAIADALMTDSVLYGDAVGMVGFCSFEYRLSEYLCSFISPKDQVQLALNHPSPVIRGYVFNQLIEHYPHEAVDVAIQGLADTTDVLYHNACEWSRNPLNEFRTSSIICGHKYYKVSNADYECLEKAILYSDQVKNLDSYGRLYDNLEPKVEYYPRLRELFDREQYVAPIIALAKYRKEEDKQSILELFQSNCEEQYLLNAVAMWPNPAFAPHLRNLAQRKIQDKKYFEMDLCSALMKYEEPWVGPLILKSIDNLQDYEKSYAQFYFMEAYEKNPSKFFKSLYEMIKKD